MLTMMSQKTMYAYFKIMQDTLRFIYNQIFVQNESNKRYTIRFIEAKTSI